MTLGSLNGVAATRMRVQIADWGRWWCDVDLAEPAVLAGAAAVVLADIAGSGTIVSGGAVDGKAAYRVVGGKGGWGKRIKAKGYVNDAGVKVSGVVQDAAREVGETVDGLPATKLAAHYTRDEAPASKVLQNIFPQGWRVDLDGVTRFGKLPIANYTGDGTRTKIVPDGRIIEIATESIAQLLPGVTIDGGLPATDVEYLLDASRLTVRVYSGLAGARFATAYKRIFDALFPDLKWRGTYEFRVVEQVSNRFELQPVRSASGMPELSLVPARGSAGVRATVQPGELVLVSFVDGDPSRPVIIAHDEIDGPGWMPLFLQLGEEPTLGVARLTDAVIAGPFVGAITFASVRIKAGL